jgi:hypothetical protein
VMTVNYSQNYCELFTNSIFKFLALDISDYRIIGGLAERVGSPCLSASVVLEL